jgi:hypothetical protein
MEKFEYRPFIETRALLGIPATVITEELEKVYSDKASKYRTLAKWVALFKDGRQELEDNPRSGRSITTHTASNIEADPQKISITLDTSRIDRSKSRGLS